MITLGQISFVVIIQTIIFLLMLSVFLFFLVRSKNKQIKKLKHASKGEEEHVSASSIEHYLVAEIKLTQSRFDLFYKEEDVHDGILAEPDWLLLRKTFLDMEKEFLSSRERDDAFWVGLGDKLKKVLSNSHLVKRIKLKDVHEDDDDEIKEMKNLLKSQYDTFDDLCLKLEGEKSAAEIAELKEKLNIIIRSHTELSQCIYVLEDENKFLRDQISSLLK
ncbi:MAG: hypothetical protein OQK75_06835 [Gammaproteobacteria bacterium]|nr:hypothetical protein [Gammaproteobacteria bacterium]MCW8987372.1 hypothetical protein [Gammaproteobacteria bacterium]